jgi:hypothetical protein
MQRSQVWRKRLREDVGYEAEEIERLGYRDTIAIGVSATLPYQSLSKFRCLFYD